MGSHLRVRLDRTNAFTQRKAKLEKEQDDHLKAIRRGLQPILRELEKTVLPTRRAAAVQLQEFLDPRPTSVASPMNFGRGVGERGVGRVDQTAYRDQ